MDSVGVLHFIFRTFYLKSPRMDPMKRREKSLAW